MPPRPRPCARCGARKLDVAIDLAAAEGWNPGLHDAAACWEADPEGFLVAEVEGELAGCISAVSYEGVFGFIGLFIVRPHLRGGGPGSRLWAAAAERLAGHLVGLGAVPAQRDYYLPTSWPSPSGCTTRWPARFPPGDAVFLDVPLPNTAACELATARRMAPGFETARICTGAAPTIELDRIYGGTTFELG